MDVRSNWPDTSLLATPFRDVETSTPGNDARNVRTVATAASSCMRA
jgi:hypothetical protein